MKKLAVLCIILLFATNFNFSIASTGEDYQIYTTTDENSNWFILKTIIDKPTKISLNLTINAISSPTVSWFYTDRFFIMNEEKEIIWEPFLYFLGDYSYRDFYFEFGDFEYNRLTEKNSRGVDSWMKVANITLPADTLYFITLVPNTDECTIQYNISGLESVGTTSEGSSTFLYENECFDAKFNFKNALVSCMLGGTKTIEIKNEFIGVICPPMGNPSLFQVQYTNPKQETYQAVGLVYYRNRLMHYWLPSKNDFNPFRNIIMGDKGYWTFRSSMVGGLPCSTVILYGADVILP